MNICFVNINGETLAEIKADTVKPPETGDRVSLAGVLYWVNSVTQVFHESGATVFEVLVIKTTESKRKYLTSEVDQATLPMPRWI